MISSSCHPEREREAVEGPRASLHHLQRLREPDPVPRGSQPKSEKAIDNFEAAGKKLNESLTRKLPQAPSIPNSPPPSTTA